MIELICDRLDDLNDEIRYFVEATWDWDDIDAEIAQCWTALDSISNLVEPGTIDYSQWREYA